MPHPAEVTIDGIREADNRIVIEARSGRDRAACPGCGTEQSLVVRTRERYAAVQQLLAGGSSLAEIGRELDLEHGTVRRLARATSLDELLVKAVNRASVLDGYTQHPTIRFAAGVTNATVLHTELAAFGFTGSVQTVRHWLHPLRTATPTAA